MLTIEFELALAQRYVTKTKQFCQGDKTRKPIYDKAHNFMEQARSRKRTFDELKDDAVYQRALGNVKQAKKLEAEMERLEGEIFLRCSRVNMVWHHDLWGTDIETEERQRHDLPPASD